MEDRRKTDAQLSLCVSMAYTNGLETMALTEKQEKVQVCETNMVRRIVGAERVDKRITDELRVEVGMNFKRKLARSSLTWAGYAERMGNANVPKRADAEKVEGKSGERGPKLRWVIA